jgi:large subunit ribosomal protein L10
MSKYVKDLIVQDLKQRLDGIQDALLVDVVGMDANSNNRLRRELEGKDIHLLVIKNSLARRAAQGGPLEAMFDGIDGSSAVCWGGEDIVSLAKQITKMTGDDRFAPFQARGGVMDGAKLTAEDVKAVSKWPSRPEQLSILAGQILSVGANLASQLTSTAAALASQIQQKAEGEPEAAPADET